MAAKTGLVKVILAVLIWGTVGAFARWSGLNPLELSFFRLLIAALALYFLLPREERFFIFYSKDYPLICLSGILFALDSLLFFQALKITTISNAVIPYNMQPVFMFFLSAFFLKEKIKGKYIGAFVFSIIGVAILLTPSLLNLSYHDTLGILLSLLGALSLAITALAAQMLDISAVTFVYYKMFIAAICLFPFVKKNVFLSFRGIIMIFIIGLIHTALAYILYYNGLKSLNIQHVVVLTYFIPVVAALTGYLLFHEAITLYTIAGGLLIAINGLVVILRN